MERSIPELLTTLDPEAQERLEIEEEDKAPASASTAGQWRTSPKTALQVKCHATNGHAGSVASRVTSVRSALAVARPNSWNTSLRLELLSHCSTRTRRAS